MSRAVRNCNTVSNSSVIAQVVAVCALLWAVSPTITLAAQSLTGTTGLVSVPTAEMPTDGALAVGVNVLDRRYSGYGVSPNARDYAVMVQYVSVGFLPFAEVGLRLTRRIDYPRPQALGDRMVSVRVRVLNEGEWTPAVVAGVHDVVGTHIFHSSYLVGSMSLDAVPLLGGASAHLGYGDVWPGLPVRGRQFQGVFGGVAFAPRQWVALLVEHDTKRINAGIRLGPLRGVSVLAAVQGGDGLSGGISYTHQMR